VVGDRDREQQVADDNKQNAKKARKENEYLCQQSQSTGARSGAFAFLPSFFFFGWLCSLGFGRFLIVVASCLLGVSIARAPL